MPEGAGAVGGIHIFKVGGGAAARGEGGDGTCDVPRVGLRVFVQ